MKILFICAFCDKKTYNEIFNVHEFRGNQQSQKFCRVLSEGLKKNGAEITIKSFIAVSRFNTKIRIIHRKSVVENGIPFLYAFTLNFPVIKNVLRFFQSFFCTLFFCLKNKEATVMCDPMALTISIGALLASKLTGSKSLGILTDIPQHHVRNVGKEIPIHDKWSAKIINLCNMYLLLSEYMNSVINKNNKPYVVIEGFADEKMSFFVNQVENKYPCRVMMYTGGLVKHYGLEMIINAFSMAKIPNAQFHIYGTGTFKNELLEMIKEKKNILYKGVFLNDVIVIEQQKATLLVNPRLTDSEYAKYSFPSKNIEYMVSGTPLVTTHIPSMPDEYLDYVYIFSSETVDGMVETLKKIFDCSNYELHEFGMKCREWMLKNKTNTILTKKVINLIDNYHR